jgi:hypothetical protein
MKRLRAAAQEEDALPPLPGEVWHHVTTFLSDEKDYKSLALAVPELGRYILRNGAWLIPVIMGAFGHVHSFREPRGGRRLLPIGPFPLEAMAQLWYRHDLLHRRDGPAYGSHGVRMFYFDGLLHCANGPALRTNYVSVWYNMGQLIRVMLPYCPDEYVPAKPSEVRFPMTRNAEHLICSRGLMLAENALNIDPFLVLRLLRTGKRGTLERDPLSKHLYFCPHPE